MLQRPSSCCGLDKGGESQVLDRFWQPVEINMRAVELRSIIINNPPKSVRKIILLFTPFRKGVRFVRPQDLKAKAITELVVFLITDEGYMHPYWHCDFHNQVLLHKHF